MVAGELTAGGLTERQLGAILSLGKARKAATDMKERFRTKPLPVFVTRDEKYIFEALKDVAYSVLDEIVTEIDELIQKEGTPYFYK